MKYAVNNKNSADTVSNTPFFRKENNPLTPENDNGAFFKKPVQKTTAANQTVQRACDHCEKEKKLQKKEKEQDEEKSGASPAPKMINAKASNGTPTIQRVTDPIPEANNQFYGHGAFMGAAPQLMADAKWNRILRALMPDVHADATKALSSGPNSPELILMFENNPVMAAYGAFQTRQMDLRNEGGRNDRIQKMQAIEWDVFLPTAVVVKYNAAKDDAERQKLAGEMVNEMIIAHGTTWQTMKENAPGGGWRQWDNVRQNRKSGQGGVRPGAWMDLFGRALELATIPNWEDRAKEFEDPALHPRVNDPEDQAAHGTFQNQLPFRQVVDMYKRLFGKETFSVLLDIKSRDASPHILRGLVGELNRRGVHVYGVGSFQHHEIAGLGGMTQIVDGKTFTGPKEIKFYHLAGDLQIDCLKGNVKHGDTVMFNAGSLISYDSWRGGKGKKASYRINDEVVKQLDIYKKHYGFSLGVYVQENDIDDRAATLLTELTNRRPDIFDLGFAWGGLSGQAASDIEPTWRHATVGIYNQATPGHFWDTDKPLPSGPTVAGMGFSSTIWMRRRFLRSRNFEVSSGSVTVIIDASWNDPTCVPDRFFVTLNQDEWGFDSEYGSIAFPIGGAFGASWNGLEEGDYYLTIWFPGDHDPNCILSGNINVSI